MNQDYHYCATFLASSRADFTEEDADKIAWAALMVDEMTSKQYKKMNYPDYLVEITSYEYNETIALAFALADDFIQNYACKKEGLNEEELIGVLENTVKSEFEPNTQLEREIWIPFHFLPGNLIMKNDQTKEWKYRYEFEGKDTDRFIELVDKDRLLEFEDIDSGRFFDKVWDGKDFACMCFPNSELAEEMVKDTRKVFHKESYNKEFKLMLLGIRMHVLADTWAHQGFTGSRNFWCNNVSIVRKASRNFGSALAWSNDNHSLSYLGHLKMGHLPDQGYQKYSYQAQWKKQRIEVDNVARFSNALAQMYNALKFIQCKEPCSQVKSKNGCLMDPQKCDTCPDLYISQWNTFEEERKKSPIDNKMVENMIKLIKDAEKVLSHDPGTADGNQIMFWKDVLPISFYSYIEAKTINKDLYFAYVSAAAYHRKWVMREVNSRLKCINPEWTYFSEGQEWR